MKRYIIFGLLLIVFSITNAQLLWKISGNKIKEPSFLFGTHHLISANFLDSIPNIYKCFNSCNTIVGELDMNNLDSKTELYKAAMMPRGKNIKDYIKDANYAEVDSALKSVLKFGLKELSVIQPNLILLMYRIEVYKQKFGYNADFQVDSYFQAVGNEKGKKIIALETIDKQMKLLFDTTNIQRQADVLVESIRKNDKLDSEMVQIQQLYKTGNLDGLLQMAQANGNTENFTPKEYTEMIDNRNKDWAIKLPVLMANSACFIAVGAMHLPGKNGLIQLLEKAGYKLKPVK